MAVRKPLVVLNDNSVGELPAGDSLPSTPSGPPYTSIQTSEALTAGQFVRIHSVSGNARIRKANLGTANGDGRADGFVLASYASGVMADMYFSGENDGLSSLVPGTLYVLGIAGAVLALSAVVAVSGQILQPLGVAKNSSTLLVNIDEPIIRA